MTNSSTPHYRDMINADGTFNRSAIMRIAVAHTRADHSGDTYRRIFARELRTVWQIAQGMKNARAWQKAA